MSGLWARLAGFAPSAVGVVAAGMGEVSQWSATHLNGDTDQHQQGSLHGIVVRNTFIDVCHPQDIGDDDGAPTSPGHRRNSSAPPSPGRRSRGTDEWGKDPLPDEELFEDEIGGVPGYQYRPEGEQAARSEWPEQYIEDEPPAHKVWRDRAAIGSSGSSPPGLLLSSPADQKDSKGARKVRPPHLTLSTKGYKAAKPAVPLETHSRSGEHGFDSWHSGPGQGFAAGSATAFSYANGFGVGCLGADNVPDLAGHALAAEQRGREGAIGFPFGHHGHLDPGQVAAAFPFGQGLGAGLQIGPDGHPGLGGLGSFGQDIWNMDASARWVNPSMHQVPLVPPPPIEPPPPRDASQRTPQRLVGEVGGEAHHGQAGNRKQRRGHLIQQSTPAEGSGNRRSPPGNLGPGGAYGQPPGGAGLGIAAGAAAVGPVVSASHSGPPTKGSPHSGGRGRDPLVVGPPAVGSAAGLSSSFPGQEASVFPSSSAASAGGPPAEMGISQRGMVNAGKGGQGPWIPAGVDISAALAMAGRQERGGGRGRRDEAKGAGGNNADAGIPTNAAGSRMPLSGGGPKRTDYVRKYGPAVDDDGNQQVPIVTMMLKNIPCRKAQEEVMSHIDGKGFSHKYDFFYLPRDVKFRANLGYAFINFVTPEDAAAFQAEMNGYRFANSGSSKACVVVPAHVQGLMNNLAAFKRTEVMRSSRKPYFSGAVAL